MQKQSFSRLYEAFEKDKEYEEKRKVTYNIQKNNDNTKLSYENPIFQARNAYKIYETIKKHKKITEILNNYETFKKNISIREKECFKDYKTIKNKGRKTKKYKRKMRDFQVKKYLNIMYENNRLYKKNKSYKGDDKRIMNMSEEEFNKEFNNKQTYDKNHHNFCNAPEKTTLHSTKILNQKDVNKNLS